MPRQKDLKRHVRSRMRKTGESYTAARSRILQKRMASVPEADFAELAGLSNEAVAKKTGKPWKGWVRTLDALDAASMPHRDIARHLHDELGLPSWWAQTVTVGYERIRGLREKGQLRGGGYRVTKSKTYPVPVAELYKACGARSRRKWLGDVELSVKKATPRESMRITWGDGTPVELGFRAKDRGKSQLQLQHGELPSRGRADELRAFWTERLAALGELLRG